MFATTMTMRIVYHTYVLLPLIIDFSGVSIRSEQMDQSAAAGGADNQGRNRSVQRYFCHSCSAEVVGIGDVSCWVELGSFHLFDYIGFHMSTLSHGFSRIDASDNIVHYC
jgi:hypothetical protein